MARPRPTKLVIEFDDGRRVEQAFSELPQTLRAELLCQPFVARSNGGSEDDGYLLLEWHDGWKEVMRVDPSCSDVGRYYVISRPEEVGRLSLSGSDGYPELVEIQRRPRGLARLTLAGKASRLEQGKEEREGRKTEVFFSLSPEAGSLGDLREQAHALLARGDISLEQLTSSDHETRLSTYRSIADSLGLRPARNLQDVLDFVAYLASDGSPLVSSDAAANQGERA